MEVSFLDHFSVSKPIKCITIADLLMFAWLTKWSMDIFSSVPLPHCVPLCSNVCKCAFLLFTAPMLLLTLRCGQCGTE